MSYARLCGTGTETSCMAKYIELEIMSRQFYIYILSTECYLGITHILKHPDCIKGYSVRTMVVPFIGQRPQMPNGLPEEKKYIHTCLLTKIW
jgi:hypothetical protein